MSDGTDDETPFDPDDLLWHPVPERHLESETWRIVSAPFRVTDADRLKDKLIALKFSRTDVGAALRQACAVHAARTNFEVDPASALAVCEDQDFETTNPLLPVWQEAINEVVELLYGLFPVDLSETKYDPERYYDDEGRAFWEARLRRGQLFSAFALEAEWEKFKGGGSDGHGEFGEVDFSFILDESNSRIAFYLEQPLRIKAIEAALLRWALAAEPYAYFHATRQRSSAESKLVKSEKTLVRLSSLVCGWIAVVGILPGLIAHALDVWLDLNGFLSVLGFAFSIGWIGSSILREVQLVLRTLLRGQDIRNAEIEVLTWARQPALSPEQIRVVLTHQHNLGVIWSGRLWHLLDDLKDRGVRIV